MSKANVPLLVVCALVWAVCSGLCPDLASAQGTTVAPKHHPWARFQPGAWKQVRAVTETLDEKGLVASTSITETRTTLQKVDNSGVTLSVEVCVEMAGKRFATEPQTITQGLHGEPISDDLKISEPSEGAVVIEGKKVPCKVYQLEYSGPTSKTIAKIYYNEDTEPYVLRRERISTDAEGENTVSETLVDTLAIDMPERILGRLKNTVYIRRVEKNARGTTTTFEVVSPDVPGGVVSNSSKEVDKEGRLVRRSTLDLVDYGTGADRFRRGFFGRQQGWFMVPSFRIGP